MAKTKKKKVAKGKVAKGKVHKGKTPKATKAKNEDRSTIGRKTGLKIGEWFTARFKSNFKKHSTDPVIASEATKEFPERGGYTERDVLRRRARYNRLEAGAKKLSKFEKGGEVTKARSRDAEAFNKKKKAKGKVKKGKVRKAA